MFPKYYTWCTKSCFYKLINRPGVAGAVLQASCYPLINSFIKSCITCHISHVTCHMSRVTCYVSNFMCHISCVMYHLYIYIYIYFCLKNCGPIGEVSRWRVCYQRGLPRLVNSLSHDLPPESCKRSINVHYDIQYWNQYIKKN